jgi:D-lactate dehydrogenase
MQIVFFSTKSYDRESFRRAAGVASHELVYLEPRLTAATARLAEGADAACVFVNDEVSRDVLATLHQLGLKLLLLRSSGFNHVDLKAATDHQITVMRVPAYSPHAVAEHAIALLMTLNRKIHRASNRVREGNFSLDGLLGFDLVGKTLGVVGTGKIGQVMCRIATGFGCEVLAYDLHPNDECRQLGVRYVPLEDLYARSHVISLHCPLVPATHHLINDAAVASMRQGVVIVNTSRGALIDTAAAIRGLKSRQLGGLALDVYEEEGDLFFEDLSSEVIQDDIFARLLTFPNVLVTGHQAFFTQEALQTIAETTLKNATAFENGDASDNQVTWQQHVHPTD